jgi:histidinol-phosphatase (PHP family)
LCSAAFPPHGFLGYLGYFRVLFSFAVASLIDQNQRFVLLEIGLSIMYPRNLHTHTWRCKHAIGDVVDYCEAALAANLKVLGFSEHAPLPNDPWDHVHMDMHQLQGYSDAIAMAKASYAGRLKVLQALECEYVPENHNFYVEELCGRQGCDYLIGGAHWYPDPDQKEWPCSFYDIKTAEDMRKFSRYTVSMIESGLFAFIAHPDVFAHCYYVWDADTEACCRDILAAAAAHKVALELNALGLRRPIHETPQGRRRPYPYRPFWELAADYDVTIVCNSDAHQPGDIVAQLDQVWKIAVEIGLREDPMFME